MKKKFLVLFFLSIGVAIMGLYNCFGFFSAGGAGPLKTWAYGLGPFLGGGLLSIFILWLYGHTLEIKCPSCGQEYIIFGLKRAGNNFVGCSQCGQIIWPTEERPIIAF